MNVISNVPSGMTRADYSRLNNSKVEFIRVSVLPTEVGTIKEYPYIYLLIEDGSTVGKMYEYVASENQWYLFGGGADGIGAICKTYDEYMALTDAEKESDVFYVITDRNGCDITDMSGRLAPLFVGTTLQYNQAVENDELDDGTIVILNDDAKPLSLITGFVAKTVTHKSDGSVEESYPTLNCKVVTTTTSSDTEEVKTSIMYDLTGNVLSTRTTTTNKTTNDVVQVVE